MKRLVTVHEVADRHRDLHGREFARTLAIEVERPTVAEAIASALVGLAVDDAEGKVIVTVDWPYE